MFEPNHLNPNDISADGKKALANVLKETGNEVPNDITNSDPAPATEENEPMASVEAGWVFVKYLYPQSIRIPWPAGEHDAPEVAYFEMPLALADLFERVFITEAPGAQKIVWVNRFKRINEQTGQPESRPQYQNMGVPGLAFERDKCTALPIEIAQHFFEHGQAIFRNAGERVPQSQLAKRVPRRSSDGFYIDK